MLLTFGRTAPCTCQAGASRYKDLYAGHRCHSTNRLASHHKKCSGLSNSIMRISKHLQALQKGGLAANRHSSLYAKGRGNRD